MSGFRRARTGSPRVLEDRERERERESEKERERERERERRVGSRGMDLALSESSLTWTQIKNNHKVF